MEHFAAGGGKRRILCGKVMLHATGEIGCGGRNIERWVEESTRSGEDEQSMGLIGGVVRLCQMRSTEVASLVA